MKRLALIGWLLLAVAGGFVGGYAARATAPAHAQTERGGWTPGPPADSIPKCSIDTLCG